MNEPAYRAAEARLWSAVGAAPTERWVHLPRLGTRIRVQEVGAGRPVLYVHGGPTAGTTWAPLVGHVRGFRSLIIDRPGAGLSEQFALTRENLHDVADHFVADVLDALELERAHVVASSFGGFLSLRSAAATPERFDRMVQMACPAGATGMLMPTFFKALVAPGLRWLIRTLPPNERAARSSLRQMGHGPSLDAGRIAPELVDWSLALQGHTDTMANEMRMIREVASVRGFDPVLALPRALLARVATPTHLYWGAADTFGGAEVAQRMAAALPAADLQLVADAGHLPWLDDPAGAAEAVMRFLARTGRPDGQLQRPSAQGVTAS